MKNDGDWTIYKRLLTYVAPYWYLLTVSIVGFLAAAGAEAYFGYLFGQLIDAASCSCSVALCSYRELTAAVGPW